MTDATEMPKYDGMGYEELVVSAQFLWMENAKLREALKNSVNCRRFGGCFTCPMFHEDAQPNEMCGNDILMNRLGIEVQDDRR